MDIGIDDLLDKRIKYLDSYGEFSPTMGVVNNNYLNPKFFKLRKVFTKNTGISTGVRGSKVCMTDILGKKSLIPYKALESITPNLNKIKYIRKNLPDSPKLSNMPYLSYNPQTHTKDYEFLINHLNYIKKNPKLPKLSMDPTKSLADNKDLKKPNPNLIYSKIHAKSREPAYKNPVSRSLNITSNKRIIFSKKSKEYKNFYNPYDQYDLMLSSESSLSEF